MQIALCLVAGSEFIPESKVVAHRKFLRKLQDSLTTTFNDGLGTINGGCLMSVGRQSEKVFVSRWFNTFTLNAAQRSNCIVYLFVLRMSLKRKLIIYLEFNIVFSELCLPVATRNPVLSQSSHSSP